MSIVLKGGVLANKSQAKFSPEDLEKIGQTLGVDVDDLNAQIGPHWWPQRSLGPIPPTDPVIYRLYEVRRLNSTYSTSYEFSTPGRFGLWATNQGREIILAFC